MNMILAASLSCSEIVLLAASKIERFIYVFVLKKSYNLVVVQLILHRRGSPLLLSLHFLICQVITKFTGSEVKPYCKLMTNPFISFSDSSSSSSSMSLSPPTNSLLPTDNVTSSVSFVESSIVS